MKFFSACKDSKLAQKIQANRGVYSLVKQLSTLILAERGKRHPITPFCTI